MSPEWTIDASVTRDRLGLPVLAVNPSTGYSIVRDGVGPGDASWRRETVQSPYVGGRFLVNAVRDVQTFTLGVRVRGASTAQLTARMDELVDAFQQFSYNFSFNLSGVVYTWYCEPADYSVGEAGQFQDLHLRSYTQVVTFNVPRQPYPAIGYF